MFCSVLSLGMVIASWELMLVCVARSLSPVVLDLPTAFLLFVFMTLNCVFTLCDTVSFLLEIQNNVYNNLCECLTNYYKLFNIRIINKLPFFLQKLHSTMMHCTMYLSIVVVDIYAHTHINKQTRTQRMPNDMHTHM